MLDLKRVLPQPPLPPRATSRVSPSLHQVTELFAGVGVRDDGADRHGNVEIVAGRAGAVIARTGRARPALEGALDTEVRERVDARRRAQIDAAAMAAIAAIRPAERHELLAPEAGAAAPAVTGVGLQSCFIDEFHGDSSLRSQPPGG